MIDSLSRLFTSSISAFFETMFFRPSIGFSFSSLGISGSMVKSAPTWRNSTSPPTTAHPIATGTVSRSRSITAIIIACSVAVRMSCGWAMCSKVNWNSPFTFSSTVPQVPFTMPRPTRKTNTPVRSLLFQT